MIGDTTYGFTGHYFYLHAVMCHFVNWRNSSSDRRKIFLESYWLV